MLKALTLMALMGLTTCTGFAGTVTYTLTATATGSLDGTAFTDSSLTITAVANTTTPGSPFSSTVVVGSLTGTFNAESPYLFVNSGGCTGSPEYPGVSSCVGFGTTEDILDIANNAFATYVLGTSIGPLTDPTPFGNSGVPFVDDSGGDLILTSLSDGSFTAVSSATPETAIGGSSGHCIDRGWDCVSASPLGLTIFEPESCVKKSELHSVEPSKSIRDETSLRGRGRYSQR